jgi:hypothetical protein
MADQPQVAPNVTDSSPDDGITNALIKPANIIDKLPALGEHDNSRAQ